MNEPDNLHDLRKVREREIDIDLPDDVKRERRRRILNFIPPDELRWVYRSVTGSPWSSPVGDLRSVMLIRWPEFAEAIMRWFKRAM